MGLRETKSNLAASVGRGPNLATKQAEKLTYGEGTAYDRPNQGFSNEPFIKGGINLGGTSTLNSITGGFIRGGVLMHAERLIQDTTRIGKFFVSSKGITFLAKQIGLQKSNPKISEPSISGKSPANHRTYNFGANTLAQVIGQGTGLHVNRQGLTPLAKNGYIDEEKFLQKGTNTSRKNKLLFLYDNHIVSDNEPGAGFNEETTKKTKLGRFFAKVKKHFAKPGEELYSYGGGPGSTYGIGQTKIRKYTDTGAHILPLMRGYDPNGDGWGRKYRNFTEDDGVPKFEITNKNLSAFFRAKGLNEKLINYPFTYLDDIENLKNGKSYTDKFGEFRFDSKIDPLRLSPNVSKHYKDHELNGTTRVKNYLFTSGRIFEDNYFKTRKDNKSYHREERIGLGRPGGNPHNINSTETVDLLNALDVFKANGDLNSNHVRDLIRFRIEAVNPESPTKTDVMVFRAFLDSMNDSFNATYNEFNYNGRAESFYTYNNFNRDISFSFKIAAQSSQEMRPLYRKLNYLLSNTAPEYNTTSGRIMTPFMKLTVGAYFDRLPGVLKNVSISWQKDYPWEITLNAPEGGSTTGLFTLPHVLDVNVTYQPIHNFLPQKGIDSPFIFPHKDSPIANSVGRKKWNKDGISSNLTTAVAKIVHPSKDFIEADKRKMEGITKIPTIQVDQATLKSQVGFDEFAPGPNGETPEQIMAKQQKRLDYLENGNPTFLGDPVPRDEGADDLPQNLGV